MSFSTDAWQAIEPIRKAIDDLPLLRQLEDGSLPREVFVEYLSQDAAYLAVYGRTLALAASQATDTDELAFWAKGAYTSVIVERALHETYGVDPDVTPSPTCLAYTSYLQSVATRGNYPVLVAAVLPCYWIYQDVGSRLLERLGDLSGHPYADWIGTYADPEFEQSCRRAREIADTVGDTANAATLATMHDAFQTASRYEWMFWDAPTHLERWPV